MKAVNIQTDAEVYDAIVIGSGISGGWAAKELCEKGMKTLILERGTPLEHRAGYVTEHRMPWEFDYRNLGVPRPLADEEYYVQKRNYAFRESTRHFYNNDKEHPYEHPEDKPFTWIRGGRVGGKSLLWARHVYRWSPIDFEANAEDGYGVDWPIRYDDLAPWYSYVERFAGISGQAEGLMQLPDSEFMPAMPLNAGEAYMKEQIEGAFPVRRVIHGRVAIVTQEHNGRGPCHYCGPCERGCSVGAYFSSLSTTLPAAAATGNLTLRPNSVVHSLLYDEDTDRVTGVRFVDAETLETKEVRGRLVFLCASTLGSTQILLNTKTPRFPGGLANSSGALGHYLMDHHFQIGADGTIPGLLDRYYVGNRPNTAMIARYRNLGDAATKMDYLRGYFALCSAGRLGWSRGAEKPGLGAALKEELRDPGPWRVTIQPFGECLPYYDNYVELSDEVDPYGIPLLRIHATWRENELAMRRDMLESTLEMMEAAGCTDLEPFDNYAEGKLGAEPGLGIHEMGTARMGRDPKTSVLNAYNQAHDVPNLFVTDGSCMTSSAHQNPSLTFMALTARAVDYATEAMKRGDLRV